MMSKFYCHLMLLCTCFLISCEYRSSKVNESPPVDLIPYDSFLNELNYKKKLVQAGDYQSAQTLLFDVLSSDIPTYWVGTKWDFNGTTTIPKNGMIACGYFLTTTMQQTGYAIRRVQMAQEASSVLIKAYCNDVKVTSTLEGVKDYLNSQPDKSCFIIGLDFHTGFVVKDGLNCYIIHSNYIDRQGVVKENIENARVLKRNKYFMIGSLSKREDRLEQWMGWSKVR